MLRQCPRVMSVMSACSCAFVSSGVRSRLGGRRRVCCVTAEFSAVHWLEHVPTASDRAYCTIFNSNPSLAFVGLFRTFHILAFDIKHSMENEDRSCMHANHPPIDMYARLTPRPLPLRSNVSLPLLAATTLFVIESILMHKYKLAGKNQRDEGLSVVCTHVKMIRYHTILCRDQHTYRQSYCQKCTTTSVHFPPPPPARTLVTHKALLPHAGPYLQA